MKPKLIFLEDGYKMEVDGKTSKECDFGTPLVFETGGKTYFAQVDLEPNKKTKEDEPTNTNPFCDEWIIEGRGIDCDIVTPDDEEIN